ncbi:hypothetical protein [Vibrio barjaei]|uniref:hypothetical protein n=1 Tax=Vibrio barjaei TaxID=1676683 RepID=UPI002284C9A0|nr:hypothetical protein [Vibrio barjaei]MCY9872292.1 hypothetical protein [Vibrio barjaei]
MIDNLLNDELLFEQVVSSFNVDVRTIGASKWFLEHGSKPLTKSTLLVSLGRLFSTAQVSEKVYLDAVERMISRQGSERSDSALVVQDASNLLGFSPVRFELSGSTFSKEWKPQDWGVPVEVASKLGNTGRMRLINEAFENGFRNLRNQWKAETSEFIKIGDLVLVPPEKAPMINDLGETFVKKSRGYIDSLKNEYESLLDEHAKESEKAMPGLADLIFDRAPSWSYFEAKIDVSFHSSIDDYVSDQIKSEVLSRLNKMHQNLNRNGHPELSTWTVKQVHSLDLFVTNIASNLERYVDLRNDLKVIVHSMPEKVKKGDDNNHVESLLDGVLSTYISEYQNDNDSFEII